MDRPAPLSSRGSFTAVAVSVCFLLFPVVVLAVAAHRYQSKLLAVSVVAQVLGSALLVRSRYAWRPPASGLLIALYLVALGWLWFATHDAPDWFARVGRGLLLMTAVALLVAHDMTRTGLEPRRRARVLANRLLARTSWPRTCEEYAYLSEVWSLREVVRDDPTLAFGPLNDPRAEVQLAVLTALQDRPHWRWDEAAVVLGAAKKSTVPEVRAAAVRAVSTAEHGEVTLAVIEYLKDPIVEVRSSACETLLSGGSRRWAVARSGVRGVLADPAFVTDGPLPGAAGKLSAIAVCDLTMWAMEPPPLSERCTLTLLEHYRTVLLAGTDPALASELGRQATDPNTPPMLRVELATLLRNLNLLPPDVLDRMTDPDQPSPIRLIAVEAMLALDPHDSAAIDVLRGLGRQSNRETALAVARTVQKYCHFDFGLPTGDLSPRVAAEVSKRVFLWASGKGSGGFPSATPNQIEVLESDDEDALGGYHEPMFPASTPGMSTPPRLKPRSK